MVTEPLSDAEKDLIVQDLETESSWHHNISTQLAQDAGQYTQKVEIPVEYQRHAKVFSKEEAKQFLKSSSWDHAIELKEGAPKSILCLKWKMKHFKNSSKTCRQKDIFDHPNPLMCLLSFLSKKRMESFNQYRIIES
jgi:hypothetical protein